MRNSHVHRLLVLLPFSLLLAACGGSSGGSSGAGSQGSQASGSVLQTIQVSEKEYSLTPGSITLQKPGTYAFEVTNNGTITHAFTVEQSGGGGKEEASDISPGSHKTVKFTFVAGKHYEMYCPIDGHKAEGMAGTIGVGGAAGGGTTSSPAGQTTTSSVPGY
jgi:uncharacterized cupredoxin-like copper-binding protein